jgi:uncharacterized protein (TIGR00369 family)
LDESLILERFRSQAPGFITMLGGRFVAVDRPAKTCTMEFDISRDFCHSGDVVQGGFITAMLDAAMTHAVFAAEDGVVNLSSLEIKTNYLETTRAGLLRAEGVVIKSGYKLAFLEGRLYDAQGVLTATSSTVAKLIRAKTAS